MIDTELFKKVLSSEYRPINENDIINDNILNELKEFSAQKIISLFKKGDYKVHCQLKCCNCGQVKDIYLTKTRLQEYIRKKQITCEDCLELQKQQKEAKAEEDKYRIFEEKKQGTKYFIDFYLNPDEKWDNKIKTNDKFYTMYRDFNYETFREIIAEYINNMKYSDFLKTPYWKAIAEKIKKKAEFKCQICGNTQDLIAHHNTYKNHGLEINNLQDLICICKNCHEHFHLEK